MKPGYCFVDIFFACFKGLVSVHVSITTILLVSGIGQLTSIDHF